MSILINYDKLKRSYADRGIINQDCKSVLTAIDLYYDCRINSRDKIIGIITLLCTPNKKKSELNDVLSKQSISDLFSCVKEFIWYNDTEYKYGELVNSVDNDKGSDRVKSEPLLNYSYDSNLIYAAFLQLYNIDLIDVNIHWFKFLALLSGLTKTTKLINVIEVRGMDIPQLDKNNKKEVETIRKAKKANRIPSIFFGEESLDNKVDEDGVYLSYLSDLDKVTNSLKKLV